MVTLEEQLMRLASLGLVLSPGVTIDDLLHEFDRASYEERPFDLVLFLLGSEVPSAPDGRTFCPRAWDFDSECVHGPGAYASIVKQLARVADASDRIADVKDEVQLDARRAWVEYTLAGRSRRFDAEVSDDWADMNVVELVMAELETAGRRFYAKDNGQSKVLFYLDDDAAAEINRLANGALTLAQLGQEDFWRTATQDGPLCYLRQDLDPRVRSALVG